MGKHDCTPTESRLLAEPLFASLRTRKFWPGFQQLPLLANPSLVICGPPWSCARGCSPQIKALLQPGRLASCLRARKAGTTAGAPLSPPRRPASEMDVSSRTSCAHTHVHAHACPLSRRPHTRTSLDVCLLCSLCRTCLPFPDPDFLLSLFHLLFLRPCLLGPLGLAPSPPAPLPPASPAASPPGRRGGRGDAPCAWSQGPVLRAAGPAGLASGLRPVCFPFAP